MVDVHDFLALEILHFGKARGGLAPHPQSLITPMAGKEEVVAFS